METRATSTQIRRAFHKISLKYHPDKNKDPSAVEIFREAATAYEVLSNARSKADYDDMLENPQNFYTHRMRYYKHKFKHMRPSTVLYGLFILASVLHYLYWKSRYVKVTNLIMERPEVREKLNKIKIDRETARVAELSAKGLDVSDHPSPMLTDQQITEQERVDLAQFVEIGGWQGRAPTFADTLPVYVFWVPYRVTAWWVELLLYHYKYTFTNTPVHPGYDQQYLTAHALNIAWGQWVQIPKEKRTMMVEKELWEEDNLARYQQDNAKKTKKRK